MDKVVAEVAAIKEKKAENERKAHEARIAEMLAGDDEGDGEVVVPSDTEVDGEPIEGDNGYAMGGDEEKMKRR